MKQFKISLKILINVLCIIFMLSIIAFAEKNEGPVPVDDMWTVANRIIVDVYEKIAAISTVLAALMTTVCVVGMKLSNNQQKVDQSVDWLKRIWIAWAIINGIGAFLAYVQPLLAGLNHIEVIPNIQEVVHQ